MFLIPYVPSLVSFSIWLFRGVSAISVDPTFGFANEPAFSTLPRPERGRWRQAGCDFQIVQKFKPE